MNEQTSISNRKAQRLTNALAALSRYEGHLRTAQIMLGDESRIGDAQLALWYVEMERVLLLPLLQEVTPEAIPSEGAPTAHITARLADVDRLQPLIRAEMRAYCEVA